MGYPDLKSDESIILTAQYIKVKSVPFELVLTNRRLIVIDSEKNTAPTQQIPLVTIRNVTMGENAIRDPVITLTILTDTADTRELALTFAMQTAGERKREAGEWTKTLKKYISEAASNTVEPVQAIYLAEAPRTEHVASPGVKKKIEISRPIKKIMVDTSSMPPKPVETTTLPEGSFCCRCGNRIPDGSMFCNRCGTPVVTQGETAPVTPAPGQIATAPAVAPGPGERKGRPIEQIIHSIEPLIEDSVPRTKDEPAVPEPVAPVTAPAPETPATPAEPAPAPAPETPAATTPEAVPAATPAPAPAETTVPAPAAPTVPPVPPLPPVPEAPKKKRSKILTIAIIAVVIIAIAIGGVLVMKNLGKGPSVTPVTTTVPTTVITTIPTTKPTTVVTTVATTVVPTTVQYLVPQNGVWVEIIYEKTYSGQVGMPGGLVSVSDTGDHFYSIPTSQGTVAVSVKKMDGSASELKVIVYKDGVALKTVTTSTPKGSIDLQYSLATPTPTATPTPETVPVTETATVTVTPETTSSSGSTTTGVTVTNSTA